MPGHHDRTRARPCALSATPRDIALALDGRLPDDGEARAAYRLAVETAGPALAGARRRLERGRPWRVVAGRRSHEPEALILDALGLPVARGDMDAEPGDVVFIGCRSDIGGGLNERTRRWLDAGAVIVTSDHSARLEVVSAALRIGNARPARSVRVALNPAVADALDDGSPAGAALTVFPPLVRLAAGHRPLDGWQDPRVTVIARERDSGAPLIVVARAGNGWFVHSVAHWWQPRNLDTTELGMRPLGAFPAFGRTECGGVSLGAFLAAAAMTSGLLLGVGRALQMGTAPRPHDERSAA